MLAVLTLVAQQDAPKSAPPGLDLLPILLMGIAFIVIMILPARKERKQRLEMLSNIEKGDKVVVNGAIVGTVMQVAKSDDKGVEGELLVKIDDNANVKLRVLRSGITRVIKDKNEPKEGA